MMRELTFLGFLTKYVRRLSYGETTSIRKLAAEASVNNYRLRAPLALYALYSGKGDMLVKAIKDKQLAREYANLFATYDVKGIEVALKNHSEDLPEEYHKAWHSYQCRKNEDQRALRTKLKAFEQVKLEQANKHVSNYRIYTDLKLNPGNINAWLKNGDSSKVSVDTAIEILKYLRKAVVV